MPSTLPDLRARLRDLYAEMRSAFKEDARNLDFLSINYVPDHRLRLYYEELEEIQSTKIKRSNGKKDDFSDQDSTSTLAGRKHVGSSSKEAQEAEA